MSKRIPVCHPDRKHMARGLCNACYCAQTRKIYRMFGSPPKRAVKPYTGAVYPQAIVKVPVRGWGYLG